MHTGQYMRSGSNPEPNSLWPASSEDQDLDCLQLINSKPVSKVDANPLESESLPISQGFTSKPSVPDNISFPKVTTYNTSSLGDEINNPTNEKTHKPAPVLRLDTCSANPPSTITTNDNPPAPDPRSFSKITTCGTGWPLGKISKSINENCPKPAQSLENDAGPEYLLNTNYQVVKQKGSKVYSAEIPMMTHLSSRNPTRQC
ncbi:hypothetical protein DSO57_1003399 [Entomophthora muscae]|uniref:Uncharacterized protein n=1 Tax=Entomophthora muscae TaxID=34485 RepID=A0ACC2TJU3_9FUNG|nr:hypothetical protein DSO57_1003399 [Entomophthora muscae]